MTRDVALRWVPMKSCRHTSPPLASIYYGISASVREALLAKATDRQSDEYNADIHVHVYTLLVTQLTICGCTKSGRTLLNTSQTRVTFLMLGWLSINSRKVPWSSIVKCGSWKSALILCSICFNLSSVTGPWSITRSKYFWMAVTTSAVCSTQ